MECTDFIWGNTLRGADEIGEFLQLDNQLDKFNNRWTPDADVRDYQVPTASGRATPALNASAPQFVPPRKLLDTFWQNSLFPLLHTLDSPLQACKPRFTLTSSHVMFCGKLQYSHLEVQHSRVPASVVPECPSTRNLWYT